MGCRLWVVQSRTQMKRLSSSSSSSFSCSIWSMLIKDPSNLKFGLWMDLPTRKHPRQILAFLINTYPSEIDSRHFINNTCAKPRSKVNLQHYLTLYTQNSLILHSVPVLLKSKPGFMQLGNLPPKFYS